MYHIALPHVKIATAFCNACVGYDKYIYKDGDILFISKNFKKCTYMQEDTYTSSAATNKLLPVLVLYFCAIYNNNSKIYCGQISYPLGICYGLVLSISWENVKIIR